MSSSSRKSERILGSFASLLSCAMARSGEDQSMHPISGSSLTLARLISRSVPNDQVCCMIPTLMLKHSDSPHRSSSLEEQAALNLARNLALTRGELEAGPAALLGNLSYSFSELINSRLRSALSALIRTSKTASDPTLQRVIVGLLSVSNNPVRQTTIVSSFRVISAADVSLSGDIVMPLVMEATIDLKVLNELVTVNMVAPGTIQGSFGRRGDLGILKAEVTLDTVSFLTLLMKEARLVVRRALAIASQFATTLLAFPHAGKDNEHAALVPPRQQSMSSELRQVIRLQIPTSRNETRKPKVERANDESQMQECEGATHSDQLMPPPPSRPSKPEICVERVVGEKGSCSDEFPKKKDLALENGERQPDGQAVSGGQAVSNQEGLSLLAHALTSLNKDTVREYGTSKTEDPERSSKRMRMES